MGPACPIEELGTRAGDDEPDPVDAADGGWWLDELVEDFAEDTDESPAAWSATTPPRVALHLAHVPTTAGPAAIFILDNRLTGITGRAS